MAEPLTEDVQQLIENDDLEGLQQFLKSHDDFDVGAVTKEGNTLLIQTAEKGNLRCLKQLVLHGANLNSKDKDGRTVLIAAVEGNFRNCVGEMLESGARYDLRNSEGKGALTVACLTGDLGVVQDLVAAGANLGATCKNGFTPLLHAVEARRFDVVEFLLQKGAETRSRGNHETALTSACRREDEPMVELILRYETKFINLMTKRDGTALTCAVERGNLTLVKMLIEHGARVDGTTSEGNTSLHLAAEGNRQEICRFLISKGANVNVRNKKGFNALMLVCQQREDSESIVSTLIKHSVDVNFLHRDTTKTALMYACQCGNEPVVKLLLDAGADMSVQVPKTSPYANFSALTLAIANRHIAIVRMLIEAGHFANQQNSKLKGPNLIYAIRLNSLPTTQLLLDAGADANYATPTGYTALMVAATKLFFDQVVTLLQAGANPDVRTSEGKSALGFALLAWKKVFAQSKTFSNVAPTSTECIDLLMEKTHDLTQDLHFIIQKMPLPHKFVPQIMKKGAVPQVFSTLSISPFAKALHSNKDIIARFFLHTGFLHPSDLSTLSRCSRIRQHIASRRYKECRLLLDGVYSQPWSLFTKSFLAVSFAVGFSSNRAERVEGTGLPLLIKKRLLFQGDHVDLEPSKWPDISLDCIHGCLQVGH